ncbi:MAG: hypothetical protein LV468_00335 [Candidatus Nitrosotenuis sp.]|jgi:hypothetical protein|uniref:hypothetical protein n=1 Tax=Candidatus Nitrosotenuis cloacae TaxID=1603555 RepID=UPI002280787D|nr:hypothetical protein [Candidatus Nitrosotenuis cloacae]MDC8437434.1 hypothetical protein [Candidatus Nitrosotenuis sp.]
MDSDERIKVHLLSIWREEKKLFAKSKECMLFLTDKHIMFVSKTEAKMQWWKSAVQRQILTLMKSPSTLLTHDGYGEADLKRDLENEKNDVFLLDDVISAESEEKAWGTVLKLKLRDGEKERKFQLSVARDWVTYPMRDPVKFLKVDWSPVIEIIQSKRAAN